MMLTALPLRFSLPGASPTSNVIKISLVFFYFVSFRCVVLLVVVQRERKKASKTTTRNKSLSVSVSLSLSFSPCSRVPLPPLLLRSNEVKKHDVKKN
jgi:hypothetical protein